MAVALSMVYETWLGVIICESGWSMYILVDIYSCSGSKLITMYFMANEFLLHSPNGS